MRPVNNFYRVVVLLFISLLVFSAGCAPLGDNKSSGEGTILPKKLPKAADRVDNRLVKADNTFGIELFKDLLDQQGEENLFISPPSIAMALSMTMNGADGETLEAMEKVLALEGISLEDINETNKELKTILQNPAPEVELVLANSIWARQGIGFYDSFMDINKRFFEAEVQSLDFSKAEAPQVINQWVSKNTRGKIEEIIEGPIDGDTIMFLINTLYFKGSWTHRFSPERTQEEPFFLSDGSQVRHPMMNQSGDFHYYEEEEFQAVTLPYGKDKRISMYVFLPREGGTMDEFYQLLTLDNWERWMENFREMEGDIMLPRFKLESDVQLKDVLKAMGMETAFDPVAANFGKMAPTSPGQNIYIGDVKHKTFVEVTEKGTEAAAATSVEMKEESAQRDRFSMRVNRPFFFAIGDNQTGIVLFMGTVSSPKK